MNPRALTTRRATLGLLALLVALAFGLRVQGLDWDGGAHLHPDERHLAIVNDKIAAPTGIVGPEGWFDTRQSPLNPLNHGEDYVYGTAPLFATKGLAAGLHRGATTGDQPARAVVVAADTVGIPLLRADGTPRFDAGYQSDLIGRLLSAVLDSLTTLAVFELARLAGGRGRRGRAAGLAAALVWATCVLAIQHSHFFVVEATLTFATALALVAAAHLLTATGGRHRPALAVAAGVATGWAGASKVTGLAVGLVVVGAALAHHWRGYRRAGIGPGLGEAAMAALAGWVTFRVLQPYAFDGPFRLDARWRASLGALADLQTGVDHPTNVQWADHTPVDALDHLVRFGFGVPAVLLAVVGVVGAIRSRRTDPAWPVAALLLAWLVVVAGLFLPRFVVFMRYLLPAYPVLAAFAGCGAVRLWQVQPVPDGPRAWARRVAPATAVVLLGATVLWGVAFVDGVYRTEHPRLTAARWMAEHADPDAVLTRDEWDDPLPFATIGAPTFTLVTLRPFATQTPDEVRALAVALGGVDYVVQTSDRASTSLPRLPGRYGPMLRYQRGLEDGSLGFEPVARFRTGPALFGRSLDDRGSEESFRVYDHPEVRIWRRTERFDLATALAVLQPDRAAASVAAIPRDGSANGLLLRRGTASDPGVEVGGTFDDTFPDRFPLAPLWWFGWFELTAFGALGWVSRRFAALPDRGIGLAKVLGPLAVAVPLWALVAWGVVPFSPVSAGAATLIAVAGGLLVPSWRASLGDLWRHHRRTLVTVEVVSLVAFLAILALRSAMPDLWYHPTGGEKPFETAFFTSVARTTTLPPADPWYSGGVMNYYYGAWFVPAVPTRLLGVVPEVALNLALATTASLVAAVTWSLGTALTHRPGRPGRAGDQQRVRAWPGIAAVAAVLVAGNLDAARQQVDRLTTALGGDPAPPFDWWAVSRVNPPTTDINEFPAWSFLFGDPHPHVLALPVLLALVTAAVAALLTARAGTRRDQLALAALLGVGVAWVRVDHTWDLPLVAGLVVLAVAGGHALAEGGWRRRLRATVVDLAVVVTTTVVLSAPYVRAGLVFDRGVTASLVRTPVGSFLLQYGTPLAVTAAFVAYAAVRSFRSPAAPPVLRSGAGRLGLAALLTGLTLTVAGLWGAVAAVVTAGAVLLAAVAVRQLRAGDLARGGAATVTAAGLTLAVVPDAWTVVNDIGRQNTVFKFGYSAWVLTAVGGAALGVALVDATRARTGRRWTSRATVGALTVVVLPALVFWPSATPARLTARFAPLPATLDGRAWLRQGPIEVEANGVPALDVTADNALIDWLRAHGRTGETLVEATGPSYTWVARVSVATGLPTVIGWNYHEEQQRRAYAATVGSRRAAVDDLYRSGDRERILRVLATYRPDYLVIGSVERALGTAEGLAALEALVTDGADGGLSVAFGSLVTAHGGAGDVGDVGLVVRVDPPAIDRVLARIDAARLTAAP